MSDAIQMDALDAYTNPSFPRRRESTSATIQACLLRRARAWIPAYAGMTALIQVSYKQKPLPALVNTAQTAINMIANRALGESE